MRSAPSLGSGGPGDGSRFPVGRKPTEPKHNRGPRPWLTG